jgi:flagellar basal-body rod protein FlgB
MLDRLSARLEQYMDLLSARQKLVASNVANVDTPGYKTKDLDFQAEFRNMIEGDSPQAVEVAGLKTRNDGNNVSLDREARLLAENALRFTLASNLLRSEIRAVRSAIQGGRTS